MIRQLFVGILLLSVVSCYEEQEGCLDPNAVNYDPSADISVGCTYPKMIFNLRHRWDTTIFTYDSVRFDVNQRPFWVRYIGFYLMPIEMHTEGQWLSLSTQFEEIPLSSTSTYRYPQNYLFINPTSFQQSIPDIRLLQPYDSIRTSLGLDSARQVNLELLSADHVFLQTPNLIRENRLYGYAVQIDIDTSSTLDNYWLFGHLSNGHYISFFEQNVFEPSADSRRSFLIDYSFLFQDFDLHTPIAQQKERMEENLPLCLREYSKE